MESYLYCKRLGRTIEMAAKHLPEGWQISIELERGSGIVLLRGPDGAVDLGQYDGGNLPDTMTNAIAYARGESIQSQPIG